MIQNRAALDPELYESDETAWLDAMSELIEQGRLDELDYANLREYLSDMAKRDRREVESRLALLIEHLLKWDYQSKKRTRSWRRTILVQQQELTEDCAGGVLRNHAVETLGKTYSKAVARAVTETGLAITTFPKECPYTLDQALTKKLAEE
jgi:hypothetical protein